MRVVFKTISGRPFSAIKTLDKDYDLSTLPIRSMFIVTHQRSSGTNYNYVGSVGVRVNDDVIMWFDYAWDNVTDLREDELTFRIIDPSEWITLVNRPV